MKSKLFKLDFYKILLIVFVGLVLLFSYFYTTLSKLNELTNITVIKLPKPSFEGEMSLEEALLKRKSVREYLDKDMPLQYLSQLLWAAQGITRKEGGRTAPSAGATYPLEIYIEARKVEGLKAGIYHYDPYENSLHLIKSGDFSSELSNASLNQEWVKKASFNLIITANFSRTTDKYGDRGRQYVFLEAGHAAQNVYLQATSLKLGCVTVGAFDNKHVQNVIGDTENYEPIYVIPIGFSLS